MSDRNYWIQGKVQICQLSSNVLLIGILVGSGHVSGKVVGPIIVPVFGLIAK